MAKRFVIIGGGPAGNQAATHAARLGRRGHADRARHRRRRRPPVGLHPVEGDDRHRRRAVADQRSRRAWASPTCRPRSTSTALRAPHRAASRSSSERRSCELLESQGVSMLAGHRPADRPARGRASRPTDGLVELDADASCCRTGSRPRIPDWAPVDGDRVLTTRDAYPPPELPEHLVVIGSGVTGVEFVHMFSSFGSQVTLIVSRQQVLPQKDPEVAAVLEDDFLRRGVRLFKGARADRHRRRRRRRARCAATTVGSASGTHALLAIGSMPNSEGLGLETAGRRVDDGGYVRRRPQLPVERAPHLRGRRPVGEAAAVVGGGDAGSQDRRARHGAARRRAPPPRLRQGGVGDLHRSRDRRRRPGRGRCVRRRAARSGSPRCRSRPPPRRSSTTTLGGS